jgi:nucleotide-binding universal stress UspA family protein
MAINKVLIPLNQSELSLKIVPVVEKFFAPGDAELVLFYVTKPPGSAGFGKPDLGAHYTPLPGDESVRPTLHPIYKSQQEDSVSAHVKSELAPLVNRLELAGYQVEIKAISRAINRRSIDLVAMSTRARVGVTRFFFQNIADELAEQDKVPVLLIHPD